MYIHVGNLLRLLSSSVGGGKERGVKRQTHILSESSSTLDRFL